MVSTDLEYTARFRSLSYLSLLAAVAVAVARIATPFDHGIWLVAYLFLVGYLAQDLLWRLERALTGSGPDPGAAARALLWNLGVVAVPLGVLIGGRIFILLGSIALLVALVSFWRTASRAPSRPGHRHSRLLVAERALVVFMAISVLTGLALGWSNPWL